ncbi:MAG TPA: glycine betaine ABC transporter substrate-binding protein, partial [Ktedonobacteraceae bacterium]
GAAPVTLKLGSKEDLEGKIFSEMYDQLLVKAGFKVTRVKPGQNDFVLSGIKNGDIDLYPEFTSTGLDALKLTPSHNPQQDYQTVKDNFASKFNIDWLDFSPNLNDTYAICARKDRAQQLGVTTISQLVPKLKGLTMALPADSKYVLDFMKQPYGITASSFKSLSTLDYGVGFQAVVKGQADLNFCYSTDVTIAQQNLVVIQDDKAAFPEYNPAPIVRDSILKANPKIATALNPLAPKLTNEVSLTLQKQVLAAQNSGMSPTQAIQQTVQTWLKSQNLL